MLQSRFASILCADWAKEANKRAVYAADIDARTVTRLAMRAWSLEAVLVEARQRASIGPVLATFDLPLGVPASYLAASSVRASQPFATFVDFLSHVHSLPSFFDETTAAADWSIERPFFAVPAGEGGLKSYYSAAERHGVSLRRSIDKRTNANPLFAKSGIPGSVGSATCALWIELGQLLTRERDFTIWPFEGDLQSLAASSQVVLGEIYPRAAYATALLDGEPTSRPRLRVAKTQMEVRREALGVLRSAGWIGRHKVELGDLDQALSNEDDFDACLTAAALLRCMLEELPLYPNEIHAVAAEGGILGTGSINLELPERTFGKPITNDRGTLAPRLPSRAFAQRSDFGARSFQCPIPGCSKTFRNSRGGWDAHVASPSLHPLWHPRLSLPEDRKLQFKREFPEFFR